MKNKSKLNVLRMSTVQNSKKCKLKGNIKTLDVSLRK